MKHVPHWGKLMVVVLLIGLVAVGCSKQPRRRPGAGPDRRRPPLQQLPTTAPEPTKAPEPTAAPDQGSRADYSAADRPCPDGCADG